MSEYNVLKTRLKELRTSKNLTQEEFAKELNIARATYANYEKTDGKNLPGVDVLITLANKFKVSLDWLCGLTDQQNDTEIKNYGDIAKRLFEIDKAHKLKISVCDDVDEHEKRHVDISFDDIGTCGRKLCAEDIEVLGQNTLEFDCEKIINDFLVDWENARKTLLHAKGFYMFNLYALWKKEAIKQLSAYDIHYDEFPFEV